MRREKICDNLVRLKKNGSCHISNLFSCYTIRGHLLPCFFERTEMFQKTTGKGGRCQWS